ncbi:DNA polymerase III subunit chi [Roseococcus sp. SDR]|uniref:DNA polymerase III subunit chi n=1 Tax=Roseococcus sp. SDR TaxID=2835532 RepID=UPI001BCD74FC|nr:DNA polymerase III subunit chi [Roseococcus sp. SDR]MBS7788902.1 DNA polymerase III subunit chi [Roseococcus sp. SDR]MBV1844216.1 DNA polymerase III subunit chi [Roseococcus sp. SDR]
MTEIGFYHLTRSTLEQALPRLLGRVLALEQRALVLCASKDRMASLDDALWTCAEPDWLPHGTREGSVQPIFLTTEDAPPPNGAQHLFLTEGAESAHLPLYARAFDLFDGGDENAVAAARRRWSAAKAAGHALTYWQQGERGWEKKA